MNFAYYAASIGFLTSSLLGAEPRSSASAHIIRGHAHNDYEHRRPLLDALDHGFRSVEADIYLVDGELLVAHDRDKVVRDRTLKSLYLDPLRERAKRNNGRIYTNSLPLLLLIDIKSDAASTYQVLREQLREYSEMLTSFSNTTTQPKAVTAVISGNRPHKLMAGETIRYAAMDGRLKDLDSTESRHFIPLISDNWTMAFKWRGSGPFPDDERTRLQSIVAKAHAQGRIVRFWAAPDQPSVWKELLAAKVDLINTDNLAGLRQFLLSNSP